MIAKKKILVQTMISLGLVSVMTPAMSTQFTNNGIYSDLAGQNKVEASKGAITINGDAYLRGKTYYYHPTLTVSGDLKKTTTHDTNVSIHISDGLNAQPQFGVTATIKGNVDIDEFTVGQENTIHENKATIGGSVNTKHFDVRNHGSAEVVGNLNSETVKVKGDLKVGGQLQAKDLWAYQNSSLTNAQGEVLEGAVIDRLHNGNKTENGIVEGANLTLKNATINESVGACGGNLTLIGDLGKADKTVDLTSFGGTVTVTNDAYLKKAEMFEASHLKIDGKLQADHLGVYENSTLTNSKGGVVVGAHLGTLSNGTDARNGSNLTLTDVTISKKVANYSGTLNLQGKFGAKRQGIDVVSSKGATTLDGDLHLRSGIISKNGTLKVNGTTYLYGESTDNNGRRIDGDANGSFESDQLIVDGNGTISQVKVNVDKLEINHNGQYYKDNKNQFILSNEAKLNAKQIVINGNVSFFSQSNNETIQAGYLELNTTENNRFQSYTAMDFGEVVVNTTGRIEGYKDKATLHANKVTVAKNGHLTITSKVKNVSGTIDHLTLMEGATFDNGVTNEDNQPERGYATKVTNLAGANATITNVDGTLSIGDSAGNVNFTGTILDKNDGATLTLNDQSQWTVLKDSQVGNLTLAGGTTDLSTTDAHVGVKQLMGKGGTVVMDATKTNALTVETAAKDTKLAILASENADKVTTSQAEAMVNRVEGVTNKTGHVEEGMYQGAITVNGQGQAAQAKNGLMADTLELASASTLSLNRILMNDVRKRLGDIRSAEAVNGVWARYDGGRLSGDGTKNKFNTIHIGGDTMPFAGTPVRVGMSASYTNGDVDYTRGNADMDAYSLAAYGSWLGDNGMFADVIARVAKAESDMTVDSVYKGKLKNMAYSLSGEFGWRFDLNSQFYAEPQVEATYTYIDSDKMTLAGKNETYNYEVEGFDSFIGRMGVLAGMKCPNQKGDVYVRASLVHEFLGDAKVKGGANATLENEGKDTWFEYGIGANFNVGKNTYLWADLERTSGALVDEDVRGTLGVRYGF